MFDDASPLLLPTLPVAPGLIAQTLNQSCACTSLEPTALEQALRHELGNEKIYGLLLERCPHLFSAQPVFVSPQNLARMKEIIAAVEEVVAMPSYQAAVLADAPPVARDSVNGARGVFFGYDFHIHMDGVALIEINTNAGGGLLNAALARAQRACCTGFDDDAAPTGSQQAFEAHILDMFREEWALARGDTTLRTIAIVDQEPESQYLYPEFLMFQQLFERNGVRAIIADPAALSYRDGRLWYGDMAIDLVYNRLTDFMLENPASQAMRDAYVADAVVLTPHPHSHALYANKRNLALLSDPDKLTELGVPLSLQEGLLAGIPRTEVVTSSNAEKLWEARRQLFFKPVAGFGSRAAYRGDKLTRRVWESIQAGSYVAQSLALPGERVSAQDAERAMLKFDVRAYVYDGRVQHLAARLYQGQTTNFRTVGGGFAAVVSTGAGFQRHDMS